MPVTGTRWHLKSDERTRVKVTSIAHLHGKVYYRVQQLWYPYEREKYSRETFQELFVQEP